MKELERTVFAAITATLLTSPTFAKALHRNFETAPPRNSTKTSDAGNLGSQPGSRESGPLVCSATGKILDARAVRHPKQH